MSPLTPPRRQTCRQSHVPNHHIGWHATKAGRPAFGSGRLTQLIFQEWRADVAWAARVVSYAVGGAAAFALSAARFGNLSREEAPGATLTMLPDRTHGISGNTDSMALHTGPTLIQDNRDRLAGSVREGSRAGRSPALDKHIDTPMIAQRGHEGGWIGSLERVGRRHSGRELGKAVAIQVAGHDLGSFLDGSFRNGTGGPRRRGRDEGDLAMEAAVQHGVACPQNSFAIWTLVSI